MFVATLFTIAKNWEQPKCPSVDERINTMWYSHTMEYYTVMKRNEVLTRATPWINLENIMFSEKKAFTKDHILYLSIHRKCPE